MDTKQAILRHFSGRWDEFYGRFVALPTDGRHNGSVKILSSFRSEQTPSFEIALSGEHQGRWCDWGTDERGDAFSFFARMRSLDEKSEFPAALKGITDEFGIQVPTNGSPNGKKGNREPKQVKTLAERCISAETARVFQIREEPGDKNRSCRIVFPVKDQNGALLGYKIHKGHHLKPDGSLAVKGQGIPAQLYPWEVLGEGDDVFLVNGEPSVWRAQEAEYRNVLCGTGGESGFKGGWVKHFEGKRVHVLLDNDEHGRKGTEKVCEMLSGVAESLKVVQWPEDWHEKGDAEDWLNAGRRLEDLSFHAWEPVQGSQLPDADTYPYCIKDGCMGYMKFVGRGEEKTEVFVQVANFSARVTEEIVKDDGAETTRVFLVGGETSNGKPLPAAEVVASRFAGMKWPIGNWGIRARLAAGFGACDRAREAIQVFSGDFRERHVYTHSGWRKKGQAWIFLHHGGAVGAEGVETQFEGGLSRYRLPSQPEDLVEAVQESIALLEVAEPEITYPLLMSVYLAPLCEVLKPDFSMWISGTTGSMKTTLAALFLCHFGEFTYKAMPGSWETTANALEEELFRAKDLLFAIDDFAPQASAAAQAKLMGAVARVVRAQGNLAGRGRMRADASIRAARLRYVSGVRRPWKSTTRSTSSISIRICGSKWSGSQG